MCFYNHLTSKICRYQGWGVPTPG